MFAVAILAKIHVVAKGGRRRAVLCNVFRHRTVDTRGGSNILINLKANSDSDFLYLSSKINSNVKPFTEGVGASYPGGGIPPLSRGSGPPPATPHPEPCTGAVPGARQGICALKSSGPELT